MIGTVREALQPCGHLTFEVIGKEGKPERAQLDVTGACNLLNELERSLPKRWFRSDKTCQEATAFLSQFVTTIDQACKVIGHLGDPSQTSRVV